MIQGLAGCLPQPFTRPTQMRVLFPDVRTEVEREQTTVCQHFPKVILPTGDTWDLAGEHIEITGGEGSLEIEQSFFDRMSDMARIAPGSEVVDPDYLKSTPQAPPGDHVPLVAELTLMNGVVSVAEKDLDPRRLAFRAKPDGESLLEGRFAAFVQVSIEVPLGVATVTLRPFVNNGQPPRSQTLTGQTTDIVDVIIRNRCDQLDDPNSPDRDFIIYYDLSHRDYNGPKPIPYPLPENLSNPSAPGVEAAAFRLGGCIAGRYHR